MCIIDKSILITICSNIFELSKIPIIIYEKHSILIRFEADTAFHLESSCIEEFFHTQQKMTYFLTPEFLLFGYLKFNETYSVLLGPVTIMKSYPIQLTRQFSSNYSGIISHITDIELLHSYLSALPNSISFSDFTHILSLLWISVMHENIDQDSIVPLVPNAILRPEQTKELLREEYQHNTEKYVDILNEKYEQKLLSLIEHGDAKGMKSYLHSYNIEIWKMGNTPLRSAKNAAIVLNSIAMRAAIKGKLPTGTAYSLGSLNLQRIESSNSVFSLSLLCSDIMYDYCKRVHDSQILTTTDDTINEILRYISEHIHEKISVSTIARHFSFSREYLSRHFHKITGQTLASYINIQKINEAKRLLVATDMPLTEISEYLSFSSQSYFHTIFKSIEGTTPKSYRNSIS